MRWEFYEVYACAWTDVSKVSNSSTDECNMDQEQERYQPNFVHA